MENSGSLDSNEHKSLVVANQPMCVFCKKVMKHEDGAHILIDGEKRLHIGCFTIKINELEASGELEEVVNRPRYENKLEPFIRGND